MPIRTALIAIVLVCFSFVLMPSIEPAQAEACGRDVTHTVRRGETMFRIALRYGTTVRAIASANGITNPAIIYAGTVLRIPCAGDVADGAYAQQTTDLPPVFFEPDDFKVIAPIIVDCDPLRPTSPTDGMANGWQTFYWDTIPSATSYRVNVYRADPGFNQGRRVASFDASGLSNRVVGDMSTSAIGEGLRYTWEVQALVSDIVVCTSKRTATMWRAGSFTVP